MNRAHLAGAGARAGATPAPTRVVSVIGGLGQPDRARPMGSWT